MEVGLEIDAKTIILSLGHLLVDILIHPKKIKYINVSPSDSSTKK
jgi:hypothetical protein